MWNSAKVNHLHGLSIANTPCIDIYLLFRIEKVQSVIREEEWKIKLSVSYIQYKNILFYFATCY